jgi:hypothetical protein
MQQTSHSSRCREANINEILHTLWLLTNEMILPNKILTCAAQSSDVLYETAWVVPPDTGAGTGTSSAQL